MRVDIHHELCVRGPKCCFDRVGAFGSREQEAEIAVAFWQGPNLASRHDRDLEPDDAWNGLGHVLTVHADEPPGGADRQHHHSRRHRLASQATCLPKGQVLAERMPQDHLFETDPRAEAQRSGTQSADRPRGNLDHPHAVVVHSYLGVYRPLSQAERRRGVRNHALDAILHVSGDPGGRHVDRLLEVRTLEWVGLVEQRKHFQLSVAQQSFEGEFGAGHILLGQQHSATGDVERTLRRDARRRRVVGPDHSAARGESHGLDDAREADVGDVVGVVEDLEARLRNFRGHERGAHRRLVASSGHCIRRIVREAEPLACVRGDEHALIVDGDDGIDASSGIERVDGRSAAFGIVEWDDDSSIAHGLGQHRLLLGRHDHLSAERPRGSDEISRPVGGGRQQKKHPRHLRIIGHMSDLVEPLVKLTDEARSKIVEVRSSEPDAETLGLWIEVSGEANGAYTYTMELRPLEDAAGEGVVQRHDDLSIVIDHDSVEKLSGATLDFTGAGMVMKNPNQPAPAPAPAWGADRPAPDLSGELPQKVLAILDTEINPAIAAHGGYAELVAVEDDVAYVRMGGGCQGCGMAAVTLSQGIEVAILEGIPEISRVVDVTDHASGSNPYYEAAKK